MTLRNNNKKKTKIYNAHMVMNHESEGRACVQNVRRKLTHNWAAKISNPTRSDFKYPTDFRNNVGFDIR